MHGVKISSCTSLLMVYMWSRVALQFLISTIWLQQSFNSARRTGLWTNTYANTNHGEYFAEGVQAFFEQQKEGPFGGDGIQNNINTREELRRHDPTLYDIIDGLFLCYNDYIPRCNDLSQRRGLLQNLKMNCKTGPGTTASHTTIDNTCEDNNQDCARWSGIGECEKNPDYMLVNCKKSCKSCEIPGNCEDNYQDCANWSGKGECEKNPDYMLVNCKKSCKSCKIPVSITPTTSCNDNNERCSYWAGIGECQRNPGFMHVDCKKSCKKCLVANCVDLDENCVNWGGLCDSNLHVMSKCLKTCKKC